MIVSTVDGASSSSCAGTLTGGLLSPNDAGYDGARAVHQRLDRHAARGDRAVPRSADVIAALRFGREAGLEIAVRGGGNSIAGLSTTDGGIVIDLSAMKGAQVDPGAGRAQRAGVTWAELDREQHAPGSPSPAEQSRRRESRASRSAVASAG